MKQNAAVAQKEKFTGTVADLAGHISVNGSEPLTLQDLQFLTRIGAGTFAKKVGNAPGTGTRGGKRAAIWEINPSARLTLTAAANDAPVAASKSTQKKGKSNEAAAAGAIDPSNLEAMVSAAVAQVLGQQAPKRRRRTTKA